MKVIPSPSLLVKDLKIEKQKRNTVYMSFQGVFIFSHFCSFLIFYQFFVHKDRGGGCYTESGEAWTRGGRGAKTGIKCVDVRYR